MQCEKIRIVGSYKADGKKFQLSGDHTGEMRPRNLHPKHDVNTTSWRKLRAAVNRDGVEIAQA
jgi:hypothetical protein